MVVPPGLVKVVKKWNQIAGVQEFHGDLKQSKSVIRAFQRVTKEHPEPHFWDQLLQKIDGDGCLFLKGYGPNDWKAPLSWLLNLKNMTRFLRAITTNGQRSRS